MLYSAYGSNMDWDQMRARCPSVGFLGIARLPDHNLAFTRLSRTRKCGVADVVAAKGQSVWGAAFVIDKKDVGSLDKSEGYAPGRPEKANSYVRVERHVYPPESESPWTVSTYLANREDDPPLPSAEYLDVIVRGAQQWQLPASYIKALQETKVAK